MVKHGVNMRRVIINDTVIERRQVAARCPYPYCYRSGCSDARYTGIRKIPRYRYKKLAVLYTVKIKVKVKVDLYSASS